MSMVLMTLGGIKFFTPYPGFDTPSFEGVDRDSNFSWVAQPRLSRSPAMQFTGVGDETITITGKMFPNQFGGISTLQAMREAGSAGKPLMLIRYYPLDDPTGVRGETVGKFAITRVRHNETRVGINGVAHKMDFTLELKAYGDDPGDASKTPGEFTFL